MNGAHFHLMVNHVSLFALLMATVVFALSIRRKSPELRVVATSLFVIAGIFAWIGVESGEMAEDVVKTLGGDTESFIHQHEQAAEWALRSGTLVALLAIALEWAVRKKKKFAKWIQWALLLFAIHGCTVFAATSFLGGQIRHTETRAKP